MKTGEVTISGCTEMCFRTIQPQACTKLYCWCLRCGENHRYINQKTLKYGCFLEPGLACYTNNGDLTDKIVKKSHRTIQLWNKKCLYSIEIKKGDAYNRSM